MNAAVPNLQHMLVRHFNIGRVVGDRRHLQLQLRFRCNQAFSHTCALRRNQHSKGFVETTCNSGIDGPPGIPGRKVNASIGIRLGSTPKQLRAALMFPALPEGTYRRPTTIVVAMSVDVGQAGEGIWVGCHFLFRVTALLPSMVGLSSNVN